jgi:adenosylcobinamide-GDP ribazoletransferase
MSGSLRAAVRFLTRIPLPGRATSAADLPWAVAWFPLVGAGCGAAVGGVAILAAPWWGPLVAAVLAVTVGLVLTGCFHEDAASDAADGLGGGHDPERVLAIMHDSRIGAYGAAALWVVLSLRTLLISQVLSHHDAALAVVSTLALACAWGRWTAPPLLAVLPALGVGLAKDISRAQARGPWLSATALVLLLSSAAATQLGLELVVATTIAALATTTAWGWYLRQRLGGQTGDLLGAGNQLVELVALLVLTAA